jgi:hypothetical protein
LGGIAEIYHQLESNAHGQTPPCLTRSIASHRTQGEKRRRHSFSGRCEDYRRLLEVQSNDLSSSQLLLFCTRSTVQYITVDGAFINELKKRTDLCSTTLSRSVAPHDCQRIASCEKGARRDRFAPSSVPQQKRPHPDLSITPTGDSVSVSVLLPQSDEIIDTRRVPLQ